MAKKTNFEVNGNKYFRVTRTVGHKADGTPIRKTFYGSGINEANDKADEYMNRIKNGYSNEFDKVSLAELMDKWLFTTKLVQVSPSTFMSYESSFRLYISQSNLAALKISDIKKMHIQEYYNSLFSSGKSTEKVKQIHKLLHNFFEYAVSEGYIVKNPAHKTIIPKNKLVKTKVKEFDIFTPEEIEQIKAAFSGNKYETLIYTAIYTGMREGELLALKWNNVNLDEGYIFVDESLKKVTVFNPDKTKAVKNITKDPKTKNSRRYIFIPEILINKLKTHSRSSDYVFTNDNTALNSKNEDNSVNHKSLYSQWTKVLRNNNIPYKKFHALRHTYASTLLANGADIKSVQDLMGHYDISVTQLYLHSLPETKKNIVSIFDKI